MAAAIAAVRADHPRRLVVATPVAAPDTMNRISRLANEVVSLTAAAAFSAVSRHYASFLQLTDAEVRSILDAPRSGPLPTTRMP
jgi:predicted phosphoribosyltransferase